VADPERVEKWMGELSKSEPVVTFCVYGFHIGCETAATLRKAGFGAIHGGRPLCLEGC
jgi:superoxide dismutase, Fe-Mn family